VAARSFRALALWLTLAGPAAQAAPGTVDAFTPATWAALQSTLQRPTVVVFSATYCPNCPAVIEQLAQIVRQPLRHAELMAVVMDAAPGDNDAALLHDAHYRSVDRLFAFEGQAAAVRHAVDPRWRGVTPFVALLVPGAAPRLVTGAPGAADLDAWSRSFQALPECAPPQVVARKVPINSSSCSGLKGFIR
jgi:thiol-disulfide isomerase/thioredoxin